MNVGQIIVVKTPSDPNVEPWVKIDPIAKIGDKAKNTRIRRICPRPRWWSGGPPGTQRSKQAQRVWYAHMLR